MVCLLAAFTLLDIHDRVKWNGGVGWGDGGVDLCVCVDLLVWISFGVGGGKRG